MDSITKCESSDSLSVYERFWRMDLYTGKQYDALIQQTFPYGLFAFFLNSKHHISSPSNAIVIAASLFRGVDGTCEVTAKSLM